MNGVLLVDKTMSSREIAELVEKRHDNVKRTIEALIARGVIAQPQIEDGPKAANGVVEKHYLIGKRDSHVIVAQLSPEFTARLVDRWQELEAQITPAIPNFADPAAAARAWACEFEEKRRIEAIASQQADQLALAAPKVDFAEAVLNSDGTLLVRDVAKTIGVPVRKLEKALRDKKVILPSNAPAAEFVSKGYFKETLHPYKDGKGNEKFRTGARVTGLGVEFLRRFSRKHIEVGEPA